MATESDSGGGRSSQPRSAQEFIAELRRLRAQAGLPSFRDLSRVAERRAAASVEGRRSEPLPPSTTSEILAGKRLPRMPRLEFVESYVAACLASGNVDEHLVDAEVARWRDLWRSLAEHDDPEPATTADAPASTGPGRPHRSRWIAWSTLVATFVAGVGAGVAGSRLLVDEQATAGAPGAGVEASAAETCAAPSGAPSPAGRDVLWSPTSPTTGAEASNPAMTWWVNDVNTVHLDEDGRAFDAAVPGGTARAGDLIIVKSDVLLQQGRHYALAFTASVDRPTTVLVRVQDSLPPIYQPSHMRQVAATAVPCRYTHRFTAVKTSARSELTFQVGGHEHAFRLRVSDVVLVEQNA